MHLSDGEIRAWLDRELEPERMAQVQAHLSTCSRCRAQQRALFARSQRIDRRLAALDTHDQPQLSAGAARLRLSRRIEIDLEKKEKLPMWRKYFSQLSRPAWVAIAVVALLAISMAFAPVRAIAGSFLGLFRVQSIDVVQVDPQQLASQLDSSSFNAIMSDSVKSDQRRSFPGCARRSGSQPACRLPGAPARRHAVGTFGLPARLQGRL